MTTKKNFLEYEIYLSQEQEKEINVYPYLNSRLRLEIPIDSILTRMEEKGYIKKLVNGYRAISKTNFTMLNDIVIINHFAQVWTAIATYYSKCTTTSKLQYIQSILRLSCAMTLSHRHRSSIKKIFIKYGKTLMIFNGKIQINFPY
jgi:hypothetical protein